MAKRNTITEARQFSNEELEALSFHKKAVFTIMAEADGLAATQAYHLHYIAKNKLFEAETKEDGSKFKGMGDYGEYTFGISKGTVSDTVNTFERFGNTELKMIDPKYRDFPFSNLMVLKKLSDKEIDAASILPTDSKATIKDKIQRLEDNKVKLAALPDKRNEAIKLVTELTTEADGDVLSRYDAEILERFGVEGPALMVDSMSYDDVAVLKNILTRYLDEVKRAKSGETTDTTSDSTTETDDKPKVSFEENTESADADHIKLTITPQLYAKVVKLINKETNGLLNAVAAGGEMLTLVVPKKDAE